MAATKVILEVRRRLGVARRRPAGSQRGVEAVRQHLAARTRRPHGVVRRHRKKAAVGSNMVAAHRRLVKAPTALRLLTHTAQRRRPAAKAPTALRLPTRMAHRRRMIRTALRPVAPTVPRRLATAHHPAARRTVPHLAATLAPPTALPAADTMALPAATARRPRRTTSRTSLSAQPPPASTSLHHQPQPAAASSQSPMAWCSETPARSLALAPSPAQVVGSRCHEGNGSGRRIEGRGEAQGGC